jgi:hypothetical protein
MISGKAFAAGLAKHEEERDNNMTNSKLWIADVFTNLVYIGIPLMIITGFASAIAPLSV